MIRGHFLCLEKQSGKIQISRPVFHTEDREVEYLKKIQFYLPQMTPLIKGKVLPEDYPRKTLYSFNSPCGLCEYRSLCHEGDMTGLSFYERKPYDIPFISPTEIIQFEVCPRQWAYHRSGITPSVRYGKTEFGTAIHRAVEEYVDKEVPPVEVFLEVWGQVRESVVFTEKESAQKYTELGMRLLKKFPQEWGKIKESLGLVLPGITEDKSWVFFKDLGFALTGKPDLQCRDTKDGLVVIDYKVVSKGHQEWWPAVSDQMLAYLIFANRRRNKDNGDKG